MATLLIFILFMAITNMIGGRWPDVYGNGAGGGRLIFRCIIPGIIAALTAYSIGLPPMIAAYVWFAVTAGSGMWEAWGWSFDEITGLYDPLKYPHWVQEIGRWFYPAPPPGVTYPTNENRKRGIIMKGVRGLYDFLTFGLLSLISQYATFLIPLCFAQGAIYWAAGQFAPVGKNVIVAEFVYGMWRGLLISIALVTASNHFL